MRQDKNINHLAWRLFICMSVRFSVTRNTYTNAYISVNEPIAVSTESVVRS